eukprot:Seg7234.1 transcript_id=Seg7234.1/GoldUCD/mRNA.D3Y31 product="hypothetical protein" protein_id=Seg7234.1/GoldUCD/D3Y31
MLTDLKEKLGLHGEKLLQMQGKVTDGQYLTDGFINAMNQPLFAQLREDMQDKFWWPLQWDPSHWLDKVFSKFYESEYVSRLLSRTTLFHTMFGHGKMHAVAKATAKEMDLPFYTTMPFAKQRFLSSSYKQFTKLEKSLEVYVNTYRDHNNKEINEYMMAGQDFVFDLLGIIDLLWPLVLLMLRGQALACPGWKIITWLPLVREHIIKFSVEVEKPLPSEMVCPLLSKHIGDIEDIKFKGMDLVEGWLTKKNEKGKPVDWEMREIDDCKADLRRIACDMVDSLDTRMNACTPELLFTLQQCFDFGELMRIICGTRKENGHAPTSKPTLMMAGKEEFRRCIKFLIGLPNIMKCVEEENLSLDVEFADMIFWKFKSALVEVIWGKNFERFFPHFFKRVVDEELRAITIPEGVQVTSFRANKEIFDLLDKFDVRFSDGTIFTCVLQEDEIVHDLYMDPIFYDQVGREFCIAFDVFYSKAGTEAIAESFYRVMESQQMDGGQSHEVLTMRSKVDWCLPQVLQCESILPEISKLYIHGDVSLGLKKHFIPVYRDRRSLTKSNQLSKVLERHGNKDVRLDFLL